MNKINNDFECFSMDNRIKNQYFGFQFTISKHLIQIQENILQVSLQFTKNRKTTANDGIEVQQSWIDKRITNNLTTPCSLVTV
jgi:hypothetical protein